MRIFLFWSLIFLFALQESNCGTAGSIQDREVTAEKRAADEAERYATPTPVVMRDVFPTSFPAAEYEESRSIKPKMPAYPRNRR